MADRARIRSIDSPRALRTALMKFAEEVSLALSSADAEIMRAAHWLDHDQHANWKRELRVRQEQLAQAKSAFRRATTFRALGERSAVDEKKAIDVAKRRLAEAESKLQLIPKWIRKVEREHLLYKGQTQQLAGMIDAEIPRVCSKLERMSNALEGYVALAAPAADVGLEASGPREERGHGRVVRSGVGGRIGELLEKLRSGGPTAEERAQAIARGGIPVERSIVSGNWPGDAAARSDVADCPEGLVVCRVPMEANDRIIGERCAAVDIAHDSGWSFWSEGRREEGGDWVACPLGQAVHDELLRRALLNCEPGTLVMIEGGVVRAVVDELNRPIAGTLPMKRTMEEDLPPGRVEEQGEGQE